MNKTANFVLMLLAAFVAIFLQGGSLQLIPILIAWCFFGLLMYDLTGSLYFTLYRKFVKVKIDNPV